MAENEGGTRVPLETQLKENFSATWNKADTPDKKKSLLQRILQMIKDMSANAQTAVSEAEQEKTGVIPRKARDAKEAAARPVIEFLQFLAGANGQPLDQETLQALKLDETQQSFLQTLAKKTQSADSATFLAQIIDRVIDKDKNPNYLVVSKSGEPKTQLEKDFEMVRLNSVAAESFKESLLKLAQEGKLKDAAGNVLTEENIQQRFPNTRQNEANQASDTRSNNEQNNRYQGRNREKSIDQEVLNQYSRYMDLFRGNNSPERELLEEELRTSQEKMHQVQTDPNLANDVREREIQRLTAEQNEISGRLDNFTSKEQAALSYLYTDELSPPFADVEEVKQYLRDKFGVTSDAELQRIGEIFKNSTSGRIDGTYEGYQDLAEKINQDYTAEKIKALVVRDGRLNLEAVKRLQAAIEDDIGVLFETLYNSPKASFQDAFSSYSEGQMLRKIVQHLRQQVNKIIQTVEPKNRNTFKNVLNDMIISPIQRRPSLEQIVHQYQQVGATIDLEKLKDILKTYNITTLQEFYNDDLTKTISDLMPAFLQKMFVQNGNEMLNDLFQLVQVDKDLNPDEVITSEGSPKSKRFVVKYREECIDYMYEVIKARNAANGLPEVSKDRINARFSRAYLDNFLLSLRGIKIMSKALPMHHKFGDLPFYSLITGIFNPLQSWGKFGLRGRGHQESGDAETTEFAGMNNFMWNEIAGHEYIEKYGDVFDNFHPAQMKKDGDKRIMFEVFPDNDELMKDLRTGKWDAYNSMLEVYKGMVFGNVIDQSGWTFDGFNNNTLKWLSKRYMGKDVSSLSREEMLELKYKTSGVITAFWDVGGFASDDTMNKFVRYLYDKKLQDAVRREIGHGKNVSDEYKKQVINEQVEIIRKTEMNNMDWVKKTGEYTKGEKRFDKIFDVTLGDRKTQVAFREYRMYRETALMGEVFHQLLLKDPNAWLGEMVQSYPQLRQGYVTYLDQSGKSHTTKGAEFYFDLKKYPDSSISKEDKVKRDRFRFEILPKFRGKEKDDYMTNVPHLQKIMNFYAKLVEKQVEKDSELSTLPIDKKLAALADSDNLNKAIDKLDIQLSIAHQIAVDKHESKISEDDITDPDIKEVMFGTDGLITYFNNMVGGDDPEKRKKYFGDGDSHLGEENSFYQRWAFSREQTNTKPLPEGDTNMKYLFEDVRNTQALDRRLGTDMAFAKAQEVLGNVPSVCKKAADAKDFDSWYGAIEELHKEMAVIADEDQGAEQKYQQLLYQTICNWFSLDSDAEKMWTGWLNNMRLGTDISMATLKSKNMTKFLLDADNRRQYLINLQDKSYLKGNYDAIGGWGFDTAEMVAGVNLGEIMRKQAIYAIAGAIAVTIATAIKEGYEEEVEED